MRGSWAILVVIGCGGDDGTRPPDAAPDGVSGACRDAAPWASAPALPLGPTQETAVVATGGKVYVLGGFHPDRGVVDAVQIFDPAACAWTMGPPLPRPVHHANAAVVDGVIFVAGALATTSFTAIGEVWAWNPATDAAWAPRAPMPAGSERGSAAVGVIDGHIYLAGGLRGGAVTEVSRYAPATDTWTPLPALPVARDHACGGVLGGKLYVAGGRAGAITSNAPTLFELAPGGAWTARAAMPTGRGGTACDVVGGRLIVVGGEGNPDAASGVFAEVEAYDAAADAWAALAPMPTPRHGMGAAAIGDRLFVPGGATQQGFGAVATHEVLTP